MLKKKSSVTHRAWNILRLALLWTRKGGLLKRRLIMDIRIYLKSLLNSTDHSSIHYGERELSFDDTPIIRIKMHRGLGRGRGRGRSSMRFRLPCLNPEVDFDFQFEDNNDINNVNYCNDEWRKSFLKGGDDKEEEDDYECDHQPQVCEEIVRYDIIDEEEGIDVKAEEFIAKFHKQMKLQRQISNLEYNEMLNRSAS